ncbi:MAG: hypothetical protein WC918_09885, partial [Bacteroidales bacterium]
TVTESPFSDIKNPVPRHKKGIQIIYKHLSRHLLSLYFTASIYSIVYHTNRFKEIKAVSFYILGCAFTA